MSRRSTAFTLIELLVVIALIGLLIAMFTAALASARLTAAQTACLSNMKQMEMAHLAYTVDNDGALLGTSGAGAKSPWTESLRAYDEQLLMRSPIDTSPHFGGGTPVNGKFRLTSYSINTNFSPDSPGGLGLIDEVAKPSEAAHFVIKVFEGPNAVLDKVNPNAWHAPGLQVAMGNAAREIQVNAHGGSEDSVQALSAYGFLDGHAEQLTFEQAYGEDGQGAFQPKGWGAGRPDGPPGPPGGRP
jgi:prepilin-type N-terminal cleavage/methylation domain-containing protein